MTFDPTHISPSFDFDDDDAADEYLTSLLTSFYQTKDAVASWEAAEGIPAMVIADLAHLGPLVGRLEEMRRTWLHDERWSARQRGLPLE